MGHPSGHILASLDSAAAAALENMLFTEGETLAVPLGEAAGAERAALALPGEGALFLWVESGLLDRITCEVLTLPDGKPEADLRRDLLLEFVNVIGGHFMDALGNGGSFRLGLPETGTPPGPSPLFHRCVAVEGGRMFLAFQPAPEAG